MIPIYLSISGFLSYRNPVELDFRSFDLACIAGPNGAGKSSLLDAITWVLFGQARKADDSIINAQSEAAKVALVFGYEGNIYQVSRVKPRDKTTLLELQILVDPAQIKSHLPSELPAGSWKPLTERSLRETEKRIKETLRLDYETFVNASFFLQGKADQFALKGPAERKVILASILGLEIWETYRKRTSEKRSAIEASIKYLDGRLQEIDKELAQEQDRRERLSQLDEQLTQFSKTRQAQEAVLEQMNKTVAALEEQKRLVDLLEQQYADKRNQLSDVVTRLNGRQEESETYANLLAHAQQIQDEYDTWLAVRARLTQWEETAAQYREQEKLRQEPLEKISLARGALIQEKEELGKKQIAGEEAAAKIPDLEEEISGLQGFIDEAQHKLEERKKMEEELQDARQRREVAKAENPRLKTEMDELAERIKRLDAAEGATCPLCAQPLREVDRINLINSLNAQGKEMGDRYRLNKDVLDNAEQQVSDLVTRIAQMGNIEAYLLKQTQLSTQFEQQLHVSKNQRLEWTDMHAPRLAEISRSLAEEDFAPEARTKLADIDAQLKAIGYDAAAHDAERQAELKGRTSEQAIRDLQNAQATLTPLKREIADLKKQTDSLQVEVDRQKEEFSKAADALATAQVSAPDIETAERQLGSLKERENLLRIEMGGAQQEVFVLDDLKVRRVSLQEERGELTRQVALHQQLERAFGKDGVPALLIEQALPQIETKSNEILDRLSQGNMSVRFVTQAAYKDKKREDLRETLDIQIRDGAGTRDYEMFSGGEAFRVNFAIRLALSEVLAQRAGARLQTLVIDEGFGSQDAQGRQRLIEAINQVRQDFAKILVITHIDELKDAFPNQILVEKTAHGSTLRLT